MVGEERTLKIKERLDAYYEAELEVLSGQEYTIGSRKLRRADLPEIRQAIKDLEVAYSEAQRMARGQGQRRSYRITPRDL